MDSSLDTVIAEATRLAPAPGAVRDAVDTDVVDGLRPRVVVEPSTTDELAAVLGLVTEQSQRVLVRGGGTKLDWGRPSGAIDVLVSTVKLDRVVAHRHGDLTATVEAGATLSSVNWALSAHRQWLPLDPLWGDRATIGGIVATNDSGPSRHRHGAPRDLIIGCTVVLSNGQTAKSGGIVVKNVAGYDLARLLTGSFGSLGVIASATFKLAPVASHSRTVSIEVASLADMAPLVARLASSPLTPSVVEIESSPPRLHVRFESVEASVQQQVDELQQLIGEAPSATTLIEDTERQLWQRYAGRWNQSGTLVKLATLPSTLVDTLVWLEEACARRHVQLAMAGRAVLGVVEIGLAGEVNAQVDLINELRSRLPVGQGSAVIRRAEPLLRRQVDPWGDVGDGLPLMRRIKQQFDPSGLLNPGRGPGGI